MLCVICYLWVRTWFCDIWTYDILFGSWMLVLAILMGMMDIGWICSLRACYALDDLKHDRLWTASIPRYVMNSKCDMIWYQAWYVMLQEFHVHVTMIDVALDLKGLPTNHSRHCTYNGTDWRSNERVSIPNYDYWLCSDRRTMNGSVASTYVTGLVPWPTGYERVSCTDECLAMNLTDGLWTGQGPNNYDTDK